MFSTVYVQLYTPKRPSVDVAEDASDEYMSTEVSYFSGVFEITNTSVIVFIVVSSCFLVWLYKKMSYVFIEVLVVLFAIGGGEVCTHSHKKKIIFFDFDFNKLMSSIFFFSFSGSANVLGGFISMGVALIITVIQIIQVPNLKVIMVLSVGVGFR
ncbi:putative peptidase A22B, signal peptide peptidase [Helianthus annuus]|uniref:Peptidase A22B, signal peptide peptidase n=1 Tax=Helianthus annuus TaxID=4232 RepID=A0A9K3DN98_HELAN|nr:putative peptidase A22B, signal peptide peptidase [Helianthus annuus]KAJ0459102.1 putative peptidase A22B, signal peptide peptidase [Helianthus annuus]KAJ0639656.1 putative peptidase A22B, signal peptide peptidase [Helianthus annuus]